MSNNNNSRVSMEQEALSYPKTFCWSDKGSLFFIHTSCSMNPTLWEKDLLEVVPYRRKKDIRIGDVIVFKSPVDRTILVHRVVAFVEESICSKGDNNCSDDPWLLSPEAIFGKVVRASRNKEHHEISGGMVGLIEAKWSYKNQKLKIKAKRYLYPIYRAALRMDPFKSYSSHIVKTKTAVFKENGKNRILLLSGDRVIGTYDEDKGEWNINYLYRFFINGAKLQKTQPKKE